SRRQNALRREPRAAHAAWDAASRRLTLTCSTQMPHAMRTAIADILGMAEQDLRVIAPDVGGGFGQKMSLAPEFVVVCWLARRLQTSVAWTPDPRGNPIPRLHGPDHSVSPTGPFDAAPPPPPAQAAVRADLGAPSRCPTPCAGE